MSSSWHSPPDGIYWSTPRQPKSTRTVNFDGNQNVVEISTLSSRSKSVSEPSSPQQWHKGRLRKTVIKMKFFLSSALYFINQRSYKLNIMKMPLKLNSHFDFGD